MELGPVFRALMRNKLGVILISLQIAFTMTVIINSVFIINERNRLMARPSGLDEANLFFVSSTGFSADFNEQVVVADDLAMLRQTPGIVNATITNAIPVSGSGTSGGAQLVVDETKPSVGTAQYTVDEHAIDTMNLNLIAGENFSANDMRYSNVSGRVTANKAVVSQAFARELFPDVALNEIVGSNFFQSGTTEIQVVGIVETLQAPWPSSSLVERSILVPEHYLDRNSMYLIRTEPGQRDRMMAEVEEMLAASNGNRVVRDMRSMEDARSESYRIDAVMSTVLKVVIATLVFITCMGIVGLAVFGINKRRKQIGTRRALGATRLEILRYFLLENFLITGVGVTLGALFTIALSISLTTNFNLPTMAWYYTPLGMLVLLIIGQMAVLGPASGAARTEPAIATRSV